MYKYGVVINETLAAVSQTRQAALEVAEAYLRAFVSDNPALVAYGYASEGRGNSRVHINYYDGEALFAAIGTILVKEVDQWDLKRYFERVGE